MSEIPRLEKVRWLTARVEDTLRQFGTGQIAAEFLIVYENYRELALAATDGQFEDRWSHEQLMKFLKDGEF